MGQIPFQHSFLETLELYLRSEETIDHTNFIANLTIGGYIVFLIGAPLVFLYIFRMKY
jgi:hypothetical protein